MNNDHNLDITTGDVLGMLLRYVLCVIFPPLAVFDKGCGSMLLVFLFTLIGWLPGTILAFLIVIRDRDYFHRP